MEAVSEKPGIEKQLEDVLAFLETLPEIQGVAVVRRDGLMVASLLPKETDGKMVAAMSAALVGTAETCSAELQLGRFLQIVVEAEKGKLIATGAGSFALLICLVSDRANLGLVLLEMGRVANKVSQILAEGTL